MAIVDEKRLKGNYGAAVVTARLSGECLVRPVAADTDVGVDLYCETVVEGEPFLHFWIQVKAGDQCKESADGGQASCRFREDHLAYWLRQPVPVFAALVPCEWPARSEPDIYIIDITDQSLSGLRSSTLSSDYHWRAGDRETVRSFLRNVVPSTTARLQVSKGVIAPLPALRPDYVHTSPRVPVMRFKEDIQRQLRTTASLAVMMARREPELSAEDKAFRRRLASIAELFDDADDQHWEVFMACALSRHKDGDYEAAVTLYDRARKCIEADSKVRDQPAWKDVIIWIRRLEAGAHASLPLASVVD